MKIGIITFHFVNNFGGALQAYALQRVVAEQCHAESEIIDYRNWFIRFTDTIRLFPITTNIQEIKSGLATMKARFKRINRFRTFIKENCKQSALYRNHFQMNADPPQYDKFICGSDQIWNPFITMGVSQNYFLGFVKNPADKIAYAPSFGTDRIAERHKRKIKKYLCSFGYLSVREKSGQALVKEMTGRKVDRLVDPTFLLKKEDWEEFAIAPHKKREYILLYIMQRDESIYNYVKKIKEEKELKVIEISRYGYHSEAVDEILVDVGPREFLGLFRDASYICTNSYHGLVYSLIFEKDFCLIPCKKFTARINNLLDLLQIEISPDIRKGKSILSANYNKDYVRTVIENERKKAICYLTKSVGDSGEL